MFVAPVAFALLIGILPLQQATDAAERALVTKSLNAELIKLGAQKVGEKCEPTFYMKFSESTATVRAKNFSMTIGTNTGTVFNVVDMMFDRPPEDPEYEEPSEEEAHVLLDKWRTRLGIMVGWNLVKFVYIEKGLGSVIGVYENPKYPSHQLRGTIIINQKNGFIDSFSIPPTNLIFHYATSKVDPRKPISKILWSLDNIVEAKFLDEKNVNVQLEWCYGETKRRSDKLMNGPDGPFNMVQAYFYTLKEPEMYLGAYDAQTGMELKSSRVAFVLKYIGLQDVVKKN